MNDVQILIFSGARWKETGQQITDCYNALWKYWEKKKKPNQFFRIDLMLNGLPVHFRIIVVSTEPLFFGTASLVEAVDVVMV